MTKIDKDALAHEAEAYDELRDQLSRDRLEDFKFLRGQVADWYIAITAACFAIGGISISLAGNDIKHPALFWWGSVLLIFNGVLTFFIRKAELDGESSESTILKQREADLWTMSVIAQEQAAGDMSRADAFGQASERFADDYDKRSRSPQWWQWVIYVAHASMLNITFGLLLFPVLLLASQLPNYMHITLQTYSVTLWALLAAYIVYMFVGIIASIKDKKKTDRADEQIKAEVFRKNPMQ